MAAAMGRDEIRRVLESDWAWAGYALGDLEEPQYSQCEWIRQAGSLALVFYGLGTPLVCLLGDESGAGTLLRDLPKRRIWINARGQAEALVRRYFTPREDRRMCRMYLDSPIDGAAEVLAPHHRAEIEALYATGEPVVFLPEMLAGGHFRGVRDDGRLVAVAGVHLASRQENIAAVGGVFTHPQFRGRGLGARVTAAVVAGVNAAGISRVVLNVEANNHTARRVYERLGFLTYAEYLDDICDPV